MNDDKFKLLIEFIFENAFRKGYKKGLKRGKSIGSHKAYHHFAKYYFLEGHWENEVSKGGHWIICSDEGINIICSNCGNNIDFKEGDLPRFCPKCKAVMVGDANEPDR